MLPAWPQRTLDSELKVLDSGQVSLGLGFQVIMAAEAAARGAFVDEVTALLADVRQRVRLVALLDTHEYIHRSGRVSWAVAKLGGLLRLQPLLNCGLGLSSDWDWHAPACKVSNACWIHSIPGDRWKDWRCCTPMPNRPHGDCWSR